MSIICAVCGASIDENAQHSCTPVPSPMVAGASSSAAVAQMPSNAVFPAAALASNIAATLAYALGFISAIAFLVLEPYKRDAYVRFHAWQSVLFSLAWIAFWIPWSIFTSTLVGGMAVATSTGLEASDSVPFLILFTTSVSRLISLAGFVYWIFLLYKAFSNQRYQIPVIGKFAAAQVMSGDIGRN